jgi:hypothetical protein
VRKRRYLVFCFLSSRTRVTNRTTRAALFETLVRCNTLGGECILLTQRRRGVDTIRCRARDPLGGLMRGPFDLQGDSSDSDGLATLVAHDRNGAVPSRSSRPALPAETTKLLLMARAVVQGVENFHFSTCLEQSDTKNWLASKLLILRESRFGKTYETSSPTSEIELLPRWASEAAHNGRAPAVGARSSWSGLSELRSASVGTWAARRGHRPRRHSRSRSYLSV